MNAHAGASLSAAPASETARAAGRGGMAVLGAKLFFLVTGFVQQPLLRIAVGLNDFGALAQALALANTVNNVVVSSGTQGVSRAVASSPGRERQVLRGLLRVHQLAAIVVAGSMAIAAPLYARFERANDVVAPLLVLALVALLYGIYAPLIGYLNGRRRFGRQAALDVAFASLRTLGLVALGHLFVMRGLSGALGTTVGWVAAAAIIVPLAFRAIEDRTGDPPVTPQTSNDAEGTHYPAQHFSLISSWSYLKMLLPIAGAQLCTNALLQVDIALLGRFLSDGAAAAGTRGAAGRALVTPWVAVYKECQTFAFLPYQLLFSVTLVLFPMLARAYAVGDKTSVRTYVARGARLAAVLAGLLVGVLVAMPQSLLAFAYGGADAARGAAVLRPMALAQGAFTMLGIATTVLTSTGRERAAALLTLSAVLAVAASCMILVPGASVGLAQLVRSAEATGLGLAITLFVAGALVHATTGAFVPLGTCVRVLSAVGACLALGFVLPRVGRFATPIVAIFVAAFYAVILVITRELRGADLAMLRTLVGRRPALPAASNAP